MFGQISKSIETSRTLLDVAAKSLLIKVSLLMLNHVTFAYESFCAEAALVRLFTRVTPLMQSKHRLVGEFLTTYSSAIDHIYLDLMA